MKKLFFVLSLFAVIGKADAKKLDITFEQHIANLKSELSAKGYDPAILDKVFNNNFTIDKQVSKSLKNQPEVKFSFNKYVDGKLSEWRITNGRRLYKENYTKLKEIEAKYKVDPAVVIALWGVETNYGTYPMKHNAIKALTNLSYTHSRESRRAYFKKELFDVFELTKKFGLDPLELKGSWAGALGQCQFMPSNVLKYAVDGNNDGKVDIWNTQYDVFASAANFVNILGWNYGVTSLSEVTTPKGYDILAKRVFKPVSQWQAEGLKLSAKANATDKMKMFAPRNKDNKVFLVSKNFDVIKRWNNSDYFAYSVLALAEEIKK
jgi:membrane-bound lytic murein transglycosylase B